MGLQKETTLIHESTETHMTMNSFNYLAVIIYNYNKYNHNTLNKAIY